MVILMDGLFKSIVEEQSMVKDKQHPWSHLHLDRTSKPESSEGESKPYYKSRILESDGTPASTSMVMTVEAMEEVALDL